jgi:DnaK suppressor protein
MSQIDKSELKQKITVLINFVTEEIKKMEEATQPISPEKSIGRISRMDAINNKSVMESTLRSNRRKLVKLKTALMKLDEVGFGLCQRCGNPIQEKRIMLLPESDTCVRCSR